MTEKVPKLSTKLAFQKCGCSGSSPKGYGTITSAGENGDEGSKRYFESCGRTLRTSTKVFVEPAFNKLSRLASKVGAP